MSKFTIRVTGLNEVRRDVKRASKELGKEIDHEFVQVGEIIVDEATMRGARYAGIGPYRAKARARAIKVEQSARKKTGLRGDFGMLQQLNVLEPALDAREAEVIEAIEDAVDRVCDIIDAR